MFRNNHLPIIVLCSTMLLVMCGCTKNDAGTNTTYNSEFTDKSTASKLSEETKTEAQSDEDVDVRSQEEELDGMTIKEDSSGDEKVTVAEDAWIAFEPESADTYLEESSVAISDDRMTICYNAAFGDKVPLSDNEYMYLCYAPLGLT